MAVDVEVEECQGCRFPGIPLIVYDGMAFGRRAGKKVKLCDLCARTFISNAVQYPEQYSDVDVMQLIGYCTNLILQRLDRIEKKIKERGPYNVPTL